MNPQRQYVPKFAMSSLYLTKGYTKINTAQNNLHNSGCRQAQTIHNRNDRKERNTYNQVLNDDMNA